MDGWMDNATASISCKKPMTHTSRVESKKSSKVRAIQYRF